MIVIPYIRAGVELKYCLRSIEKFAADEITIIGDLPKGIKNVNYIPYKREDTKFKERNIFNKTLLATEDFYLFNDDFFLLAAIGENHYSGLLSERIAGYKHSNNCRITVQNTFDEFGEMPNYYRHGPMFIERDKLEKLTQLDWNKAWGYCLKSAYCHLNQIKGTDYPDLKIREPLTKEPILKLIEGREYFSTGDAAISPGMLQVLNTLYPNKSYYESDSSSCGI
jgi:hypothetical protein